MVWIQYGLQSERVGRSNAPVHGSGGGEARAPLGTPSRTGPGRAVFKPSAASEMGWMAREDARVGQLECNRPI